MTNKIYPDLDPDEPTLPALRKCLVYLTGLFEKYEHTARKNTNPELLHDFRIAIRRTRALLSQAGKAFPFEFQQAKVEFARLGEVTGPARDIDVLLMHFEEYMNRLQNFEREPLEPFRNFLQQRQREFYSTLEKYLNSNEYRQFKARWRHFLDENPCSETDETSIQPVAKWADNRIRKAYIRVKKQGKSVTVDSPAAAYHELRKSCKKLRYLLECFECFYPDKTIGSATKTLKVLQDKLGKHQDLEVQIAEIDLFTKQRQLQDGVSDNTLVALSTLRDDLEHSKSRLSNSFKATLKKFID